MTTGDDTGQYGVSFSMPFPIDVDALFAFEEGQVLWSGVIVLCPSGRVMR